MENSQEFLAILATNIFISDVTNKYKTSLRGAWINHPKLEEQFDDSFAFFSLDTRVYSLVWRFVCENRGYAQMLSQIRARFNPIAAILRNPRKAFENGESHGG